jgi:hypothetical protein
MPNPLHSYAEISTPRCWYWKVGYLGSVYVRLCQEGTIMNRISALIKITQESCLPFSPWKDTVRSCLWWNGPTLGTESASDLILHFSVSINVRNKFILFVIHSIYGFLLDQLERSKATSQEKLRSLHPGKDVIVACWGTQTLEEGDSIILKTWRARKKLVTIYMRNMWPQLFPHNSSQSQKNFLQVFPGEEESAHDSNISQSLKRECPQIILQQDHSWKSSSNIFDTL